MMVIVIVVVIVIVIVMVIILTFLDTGSKKLARVLHCNCMKVEVENTKNTKLSFLYKTTTNINNNTQPIFTSHPIL